MTEAHPALLELVRGGEAPPIQDEEQFLSSALEHRMVSAVLAAHQRGAVRLSGPSATTLGVWDLDERRTHVRFWHAIAEVERRLGPIGVGVAVLKGIATEARWYDELGARACTDVDVLLDPGMLDCAAEAVEALNPGTGRFGHVDRLVSRRLLQHVDLRVEGTNVDLHFDPLKIGLPTRQLAGVWSCTQLLETRQGAIRVLSPEIELVLLLLHLNKDRFSFLGPFLDIQRIVTRGRPDWGVVRAFVTDEGLAVPVWKSLEVVTEVLGMDVDVPRVAGLKGRIWDRLWGTSTRLQGHEGRRLAPSVQPALAMLADGRSREKAREIRRRLAPPRPLLELAGTLAPGASYVRYLAVDRFRGGSSAVGTLRHTRLAARHWSGGDVTVRKGDGHR